MNQAMQILTAGVTGGLIAFAIVHVVEVAKPRAVVHAYVPEPDMTPEDKQRAKDDEAKAKAERAALRRAYAKKCADIKGATVFAAPDGLVACAMPIGVVPSDDWFENSR